MKREWYGIQCPPDRQGNHILHWISNSEFDSWNMFFSYNGSSVEGNARHKLPVGEAIKAYQGIGYKCVLLDVKIIEEINSLKPVEENTQ